MATNQSTPANGSALDSSLDRHSRKCSICCHPDREGIDQAYLQWISPQTIARALKLEDPRPIYRHVHATGLHSQRRRRFRDVLDHVIERVEHVTVTGNAVIRAIRAYSCLDDQGHWHELPTRTIITHQTIETPAPRRDPAPVSVSSSPDPQTDAISNRQPRRLETPVTSRKQTAAAVSNRQKTAILQASN